MNTFVYVPSVSWDKAHEVEQQLGDFDGKFETSDCMDHGGIYQSWNYAFNRAKEEDARNLLILNDDITVLPGFVIALSRALHSDASVWVVGPDYLADTASGIKRFPYLHFVKGSYRHHGISGFAFMLKLDKFHEPPFDESFEWWGGDDAFFDLVAARGGRLARVIGIPIDHVGGFTSVTKPEIGPMVDRDIERMRQRGMW